MMSDRQVKQVRVASEAVKRITVLDYEGPAEWQIVQQVDGVGSMTFSGRLAVPANNPELGRHFVIARLVCEESARPVTEKLGWQRVAQFDVESGRFAHTFEGIPAGGLYRLEIGVSHMADLDCLVISEVVHALGVGDLWVLAGQSNGAGIGAGLAEDAPQLGVHVLRNDERWALAMHPLNDPTGSTHPNVEGRALHSPNLAFAKGLQKALNYPIGLIQTALGGSALAAWNPAEDGVLYRNMLHCIALAGGRIKGMIWYQGCSDAGVEPVSIYAERFANMVASLRAELEQPDLPIITTQINKVWGQPEETANRGWSMMRDVQRTLATRLDNVAVVPTVGLPLCDGIHTSTAGNLELGQRYAVTALGMVYGRKLPWRYPEPERVTLVSAQEICIEFRNVASRLMMLSPVAADFRVEDDEGIIAVTEARTVEFTKLVLVLARPARAGLRITSCYGTDPEPTLYDQHEHRPALAFSWSA